MGRIGNLVTDDLRVFEDAANPQYQAMAWLETEGSWDWTNTSETELLTEQFLIDRYALATLYFSTTCQVQFRQNSEGWIFWSFSISVPTF